MCFQTACPRGRIVTLLAFVWLFSTMHLRMCPQNVRIRWCIVTLFAFVWLFSTVYLQMNPQIAWIRWSISTLVALFCQHYIFSSFLQYFYICILKTKVIISKTLFHCHCVFRFAEMVASNWVKFIIVKCEVLTFLWHTFTFQMREYL